MINKEERELLEVCTADEEDLNLLLLAAKAAKIRLDDGVGTGGSGSRFNLLGDAMISWHDNEIWNPLTEDDDALRLAVKLGIVPSVDKTRASAMVSLDDVYWCDLSEVSNDPHAATRRAIVRAAAEIGRNMK
jgi:hypothetical protein